MPPADELQPDPRISEISRALKRRDLEEARRLYVEYFDGDEDAADRALELDLEERDR